MTLGGFFFVVIFFIAFFFVRAAILKKPLPSYRIARTTARGVSYEPPQKPFLAPPSSEPSAERLNTSESLRSSPELTDAMSHYKKGIEYYQAAGLGSEENQELLKAAVQEFQTSARLLETLIERFPDDKELKTVYQELSCYLYDGLKRLKVR